MLLLGVIYTTFKGENMFYLRDIDVKGHHLSQVGELTAQ